MAARAADEGDQKRKFNQAHKLMKKANVDQCNFTRKLVETIDSAKSAEENAQQEIVKLDLAGEKLNWILFVEFVWGTVEEYKQEPGRHFRAPKDAPMQRQARKKRKTSFPTVYLQQQILTSGIASFNFKHTVSTPASHAKCCLFFFLLAEYWNLFCLWKT